MGGPEALAFSVRAVEALPVPRPSSVLDDRFLVVGGAQCVWKDLAGLFELYGPWDGLVIAVNDIALHLAYFDHWASLHPEKFRRDAQAPGNAGWKAQREQLGLDDHYETWSRKEAGTDRYLSGHQGGSSGMLATLVGLKITAPSGRGVLCGVPMNRTPHFDESTIHRTGHDWGSNAAHWRVWNKKTSLEKLLGRTTSMSGNTRQLLGEPTASWIRGES